MLKMLKFSICLKVLWSYIYEVWDLLDKVLCIGLQGAVLKYAANETRNIRGNPLGSFMFVAQHTGPMAQT